jgi:hypothetical protein
MSTRYRFHYAQNQRDTTQLADVVLTYKVLPIASFTFRADDVFIIDSFQIFQSTADVLSNSGSLFVQKIATRAGIRFAALRPVGFVASGWCSYE